MSNKEVVYTTENQSDRLFYYCPACDCDHMILFKGPNKWTWNGDKVKPTFSPSVRVQWTYGPEKIKHNCHFFVRNGEIQYLGDCTHDMKGKTIKMIPNKQT